MKQLRSIVGRPRFWGLWVIPILVLAMLYAMDPDGGLSLAVWLASFSKAFLVTACVHLIRKLFFDYPEADMQKLFERAKATPEGSGLALIALAIIIAATMMLFAGSANAQVPQAAQAHLPTLKAMRIKHWVAHPQPELLAGLIEHESACPRVSSCWKPSARLQSKRELGGGLGQLTKAYRSDGTTRFDALQELVSRHPALRDLTWDNIFERPDLQMAAVVLKSRDNFRFFMRFVPDPLAALHFGDAGYNGGNGGVQKERMACGLVKGCDPGQWFRHVELHCLKSRAALYGRRSACDINRHHVADVVHVRSPKYRGLV